MKIKGCFKYLRSAFEVILKKKNSGVFINDLVFEALKSFDHKE